MYELSLPGMTCSGCANGVAATVRALDPAAVIETNLANRTGRFTTSIPEVQLRDALKEAGYID